MIKSDSFGKEGFEMPEQEIPKQIRLLGFVKITGQIEAITGLHIGGTADSIDKGGIDSPVIKNPVTNEPYIPGSSLRGRMRALLEAKTEAILRPMTNDGKIWMEFYRTDDFNKEAVFTEDEFQSFLEKHQFDEKQKAVLKASLGHKNRKLFILRKNIKKGDLEKEAFEQVERELRRIADQNAYNLALESQVCRLFGNSASDPGLPSVLIVRDAMLSEGSKVIYMADKLPVTEAKMEIVVDRITAHAMPRTIERVPAGAKFDFEIVYKVQTHKNGQFVENAADNPHIKCDQKLREDLTNILCALEIIETHTGLGGNTSRGHGQVRFHINAFEAKDIAGDNVKGFEPKANPYFSDCKDAVASLSFAQYV